MELSVRETARLLKTTEQQIYRWVDEGGLPFYRVHEQVRFSRAELLEWATSRRIDVAPEALTLDDEPAPDLGAALELGGVHTGAAGNDRASVLRRITEQLPLPAHMDRELLLSVMLAREELGSTAVGDGIAIPHVRFPVAASGAKPAIALWFLEKGVDFKSSDGQPVHTVFAMVSPTIRAHLLLLAKLSSALHDPAFKAAVVKRAPAAEILAEARRIEATSRKAATR